MVCCCCLSFFQTWMALLVPASALFVRFSSFNGVVACVFIIPLSVLLLAIFRQKPFLHGNPLVPQKPQRPDVFPSEQEPLDEDSGDQDDKTPVAAADVDVDNGQGFLNRSSHDLYSESESMDTTLSEEESHSSDTEWPYNTGGRHADWSDDEESLFEIAIPSGPARLHPKNWKLSAADYLPPQPQDFLADINDDNLIEIDINMGSIKCSSFTI